MNRKKSEMTYKEYHKYLASIYNDYQNTNIYDSNYNYVNNEFSKELYDYDLYLDEEKRKFK